MKTRQTLRNRINTLYDHILYHANQLANSTPRHGRAFHATALVSDCSTLEEVAAKANTPWAAMTARSAHCITKNALQPA